MGDSAPRVFIDASQAVDSSGNVQLNESDSHHIATVLRSEVGAELIAVYRDQEFTAIVTALEPSVSVKLIRAHKANQAPIIVHSLVSALLKGQRSELICDWATELGVKELIFFQAERSVVKVGDEADRLKREARLKKVALAAAKQSRKSYVPGVHVLKSLEESLHRCSTSGTTTLSCSLSPQARAIAAVAAEHRTTPFHIIVGPEGDFSPHEEQQLRARHAIPVSLGHFVLRAEVAALVAISGVVTTRLAALLHSDR